MTADGDHRPPLQFSGCDFLERGKYLTLIEADTLLLFRSNLMDVDVIEAGFNVFPYFGQVQFRIWTTDDFFLDLILGDQFGHRLQL